MRMRPKAICSPLIGSPPANVASWASVRRAEPAGVGTLASAYHQNASAGKLLSAAVAPTDAGLLASGVAAMQYGPSTQSAYWRPVESWYHPGKPLAGSIGPNTPTPFDGSVAGGWGTGAGSGPATLPWSENRFVSPTLLITLPLASICSTRK